MAAGASSPLCSASDFSRALVDSASSGRYDVDSLFSASLNLPGRFAGPIAMKRPTTQTARTTHFARRPVGRVKKLIGPAGNHMEGTSVMPIVGIS
jgi:hypothetical protein